MEEDGYRLPRYCHGCDQELDDSYDPSDDACDGCGHPSPSYCDDCDSARPTPCNGVPF